MTVTLSNRRLDNTQGMCYSMIYRYIKGGRIRQPQSAMANKAVTYPYIPNSVSRVKKEMLEEVGAQSAEDLQLNSLATLRATKKT